MAEPSAQQSRWRRAAELVDYHSDVSASMTAERTALESALIPVTNYILVSAVECWYRHPEMVRTIDAAMPAEAIGAAARRPGCRVNHVHLWSQANIYLSGRSFLSQLAAFGALDGWVDDPEPTSVVLDFWERAARAYRADGHLQSWDAGFVTPAYGEGIVSELRAGVVAIDDDERRAEVSRFLATLYGYLFLLYFDTRVGTGDTGPYPLDGGEVLLVRDFYGLDGSEFPWGDVARDVPYRNLTASLVLRDVAVRCDDWGTSVTEPVDYTPHLVGFALHTTDGDGSLRPVALDELGGIVAAVRRAQAAHYRAIAAMTREEKIRCGAHVYFSFLRPFAQVAGVDDELDWSVPVACTGPLWDLAANLDVAALSSGDREPLRYPALEV